MYYKLKTGKSDVDNLIKIANDIYRKFENKEEYMNDIKHFNIAFFKYIVSLNNDSSLRDYQKFEKMLPEEFLIDHDIVRFRMRHFENGLDIPAYVREHSLQYVNFTMRSIYENIKESPLNYFAKHNSDYLKMPYVDSFIKLANTKDDSLRMFYENAMRAEKYFLQEKDIYISNICTRSALEGFKKYMMLKNNISFQKTFRQDLNEISKHYPKSSLLVDEMFGCYKRGNANTHSGVSSYIYSVKHNLAVLKDLYQWILQVK